MAEIWLAAEKVPTDAGETEVRTLVIKRILPHYADNPEFVAFFVNEGSIGTRLHHPHIIETFEQGQIDVARFAERFGGGGHARAAGLKISGNLEQAHDAVVLAANKIKDRFSVGVITMGFFRPYPSEVDVQPPRRFVDASRSFVLTNLTRTIK